MLWLHRSKTRYITADLIADFMKLSRLHLRGISEDSLEFQAFHFRRASAANWLALAAGERLWGSRDTKLVPILYELVKQHHLQAEAIAMGGRTSYELRQIVPGADLVRDRSVMRAMFYQTGRRLLSQIREIYAEATPVNLEAVAMANLYLADWDVVFDNPRPALRSSAPVLEPAPCSPRWTSRQLSVRVRCAPRCSKRRHGAQSGFCHR